MKVSTRGRYGLRAMIDLAIYESDGATPLRQISERQGISEQYLEQLFANLRKAGIVRSVRGAHGGYLLNHSPDEITVKDIITALEGPIAPSECVLDEKNCELTTDCVTHGFWEDVKIKIDGILDSVSLADLKKKALKLQNKNKGYFYHI